jgi:oxidoreductase
MQQRGNPHQSERTKKKLWVFGDSSLWWVFGGLLLSVALGLIGVKFSVGNPQIASSYKEEIHKAEIYSKAEMASTEGWRALVSGGTGAIGKYLVAELLSSDKFAAVTVIGRREITFPSDKQPTPQQLAKLHYKQVADLAEVASIEPSQLTPSQFEVGFCALGTTRKDAGSAANFRKIDHDGVVNFGNLAKKAGVQHLQLVSSVGASPNSFFLYPKVKGETEEFYKTLGVKQLTVFRPPLLDRGDKARTVEKLAMYVMSSAKVGDVAIAMVNKAERVMESNAEGQETLEWGAIKKLIVK